MRTNCFFVFLLIAANVGTSVKEVDAALLDLKGALDIFGGTNDVSKYVIIIETIKNELEELVKFVACGDWECRYLTINKIIYELVVMVRRLTQEKNIHPRLRRYVETIYTSLDQLEERLERRKRNAFEPNFFNYISDGTGNVQDYLNSFVGIIQKQSDNVKNLLATLVSVIPMSRNENINGDDDQAFIDIDPRNSGNRRSVPKGRLQTEDNVIVEVKAPDSREVVVVIDDDPTNAHDIKS